MGHDASNANKSQWDHKNTLMMSDDGSLDKDVALWLMAVALHEQDTCNWSGRSDRH